MVPGMAFPFLTARFEEQEPRVATPNIASNDDDFDRVPGITRYAPA